MLRALDLFCGAGGAAMGLHRAGFEKIIGIDISNQANYPFEFIQGDCKDLTLDDFKEFDLVWASPKCQHHSWAAQRWKNRYENQIPWARAILKKLAKPYIIENVPRAPIREDLLLCGTMFGLNVIRHRIFEIEGFRCEQPRHNWHNPHNLFQEVCGEGSGTPSKAWREKAKLLDMKKAKYLTVARHGGDSYSYKKEHWAKAMGIDWMTKKELTQAVPPAYSEYIGKEFVRCVAAIR